MTLHINDRGRASICEFSLRAEFKLKWQATEAVKKILDLEIDIPVQYEKYMTDTDERHCVIVDNCHWADNLITVSKILKEVDSDLGD